MKQFVAAFVFASLAILATGTTLAAEKAAASDVTLTGEVLDLACYISHGAKGPDHAGCAAKCAEMGQPVGLAASDGKVYVLVADHADSSAFTKAKSMAGKKVEIKGEVAAKDGINALTVHAVKTI
ncbi:MAG TPA: hypothetical protein VKF61_06365 [Candidatus Polarisedimenticolia bacterium]|nr:hypothetical protein [Candidatus Polarisedimenticolia bacterium]